MPGQTVNASFQHHEADHGMPKLGAVQYSAVESAAPYSSMYQQSVRSTHISPDSDGTVWSDRLVVSTVG